MPTLYSFLNNHIDTSFALAICVVLCITIPYFIGSINFALVFSKVFYKDDIRKYGSGNAGMTNMLRTYGKWAAAATLLCDMLKATVSVLLGMVILSALGGYMSGFFCMFGHVFPVFFKFKGGKGVATLAAMVLTLDWRCFIILAAVFVLLVASTKFVSLGSVIACMLYPIITYKLNTWNSGFAVIFSFMTAAVVIFMHRENIKRLVNHTENKISFSKKSKEKK